MFAKPILVRSTLASLFLIVLAGAAGCQFVPDRSEWPTRLFGKEETAIVPTRMMVMWADTVLHQPQKPGVRGFGARIYFYGDDDPDPVNVDGGLVVYAFDADDLNPKSAKPKRKFVFTADQFSERMSHTPMGTSYSVWCPWDEVGGYNEQLSLIVRFEGRGGGVVISDATVKLLPGLNKPASVAEASKLEESTVAQAAVAGDMNSSTRLAAFEGTKTELTKKQRRRQTETIDLPPSFYRHLSGPPQQVATTIIPLEAETVEPDSSGAEANKPEQATTTSPSRQAIYPSRTFGNEPLDAPSHGTRQHSWPAGWIQQLPRTPRYGHRMPVQTD